MTKRKAKVDKRFAYNRVLKWTDYKLLDVTTRKAWEVAMALKTLRELGAVHDTSQILGVGAAKEPTIFELSHEVGRVWATDLYLEPGIWHSWLPRTFLIDPARHKPDGLTCNPRRIVAQHADMRNLPYEDNQFDGVFSSSSIEHVGSFEDVAQAAAEIGRVVKPGGIISLATEWKLAGDGDGVEHIKMFDYDSLMRYIVEPSGCEMIGSFDTEFDRPLDEAFSQEQAIKVGTKPVMDACLYLGEYTFTSVHLALRKP